jgi:hypothetical protein
MCRSWGLWSKWPQNLSRPQATKFIVHFRSKHSTATDNIHLIRSLALSLLMAPTYLREQREITAHSTYYSLPPPDTCQITKLEDPARSFSNSNTLSRQMGFFWMGAWY